MTKKKAAPVKKRNPQDATLRNIRALKSRVSRLEVQLADLQGRIMAISERTMSGYEVPSRMAMGTGEIVDGK